MSKSERKDRKRAEEEGDSWEWRLRKRGGAHLTLDNQNVGSHGRRDLNVSVKQWTVHCIGKSSGLRRPLPHHSNPKGLNSLIHGDPKQTLRSPFLSLACRSYQNTALC